MNVYTFKEKIDLTTCFLTKGEAAGYLAKNDAYLTTLSDFDRASRARTEDEVTTEEFISFVQDQLLDWDQDREAKVVAIVEEILDRMSKRNIHIFKEIPQIYFIKTTGIEEAENAYCRHNAIVIPVNVLDETADELTDLIIHEMFHIFSRNQPNLKDQLYATIGYKPCPELEWTTELGYKITNPDAPFNNYYIEIKNQAEQYKVMPILYAKEKYRDEGGTFIDYLNFNLLAVEITDGKTIPFKKDGELLLFEPGDVSRFFEQIGTNSDYIIHPEELIADHFIYAVNDVRDLPNRELVDHLVEVIR